MPDSNIQIVSFQDAIKEALKISAKPPTLLLGNGFSIAFDRNIFSYGSLFDQAQQQDLFKKASQAIPGIFKAANTFDFESIMQILQNFLLAAPSYQIDKSLQSQVELDVNALRMILVEAITKNHPDDPNLISSDQYDACYAFISRFKSIYSLNYDLLLYWVIMHHLEKLKLKDGFMDPHSGEKDYVHEDYVVWPMVNSSSADLYFLHGAMHLYDAQSEIRKFCWSRTGVKLKDQILEALSKGWFPLFVSEGDSKSKLKKIIHNGYLLKGLRCLSKVSGALFIFGLSLKTNDAHIIDTIVDSTISHLYVGIYGEASLNHNKELINNASHMIERRQHLVEAKKRKIPLQLSFYSAETAKIWG